MSQLAIYGYRCARISASGQRKGMRREERGIDGDLIAFADRDKSLPHLIVEVGGRGKSARESFAQMTEHGLPPGFRAVVARCVGRRWRYHHMGSGRSVKSLDELFSALKEAA